jgi:cystathionine beta-lyase/cystathionine gamma-synthase
MIFLSGPATTATILQSLGSGPHVLSVNGVYGGTRRYVTQIAGTQGADVMFLGFGNGYGRNYYRANTKVRIHHVFLTIQVLINDIVNMDRVSHQPDAATH